MDSNRLLHFKAIAECENITKAADKLFISQPALSKSLSSIEAELGCMLFNRIGPTALPEFKRKKAPAIRKQGR